MAQEDDLLEEAEASLANLSDLDKYLRDLEDRLSEYNWFYMRDELTLENMVKVLVNKLIERNPANHAIIVDALMEIAQ